MTGAGNGLGWRGEWFAQTQEMVCPSDRKVRGAFRARVGRSGVNEQVVAVDVAHGVAILRMPGAEGNHGADETVGAGER